MLLYTAVSLTIFISGIIVWHLYEYILQAKQSGLPYILSPLNPSSPITVLFFERIDSLTKRLPSFLKYPWIHCLSPIGSWKNDGILYDTIGSTYLIVSPTGICLRTRDPAVTLEVLKRRNDFVKPPSNYVITDIYGKNVLTAEGEAWRQQRKVVAPSFSEQLNEVVWEESQLRSASLIEKWLHEDVITNIADDMTDLSLAVLSKAGFGDLIETSSKESGRSDFVHALSTLMVNLFTIAVLPAWLLKMFPQKTGFWSYTAVKRYLLRIEEIAQKEVKNRDSAPSLFQSMIQAQQAETERVFTSTNLHGNAFVMILAGHETTANALTHALINLALYPEIQTQLHKDLDDYDFLSYRDVAALLKSLPGAILAEQLRLQPPVAGLGKVSLKTQRLDLGTGKSYNLPIGTEITIDNIATHRASSWPGGDLNNFNPQRWLLADSDFLEPQPGTYLPFSTGPRACIGKRFAQVEFVAVLITLLRDHSIELVPIEAKCVRDGKDYARAWSVEKERIDRLLKESMTIYVTLQLKKEVKIPLRLVKRNR